MNFRSGLFIVILFSVVMSITACIEPIGSLEGSGNSDKLMTSPRRIVYDINDLFSRENDLQVFASYGGILESIPVDRVDISIIEDPDAIGQKSAVPIPSASESDFYKFQIAGRNVIVVSYNNLSDSYSVEVKDPLGLGETGGKGGKGGGIIVKWP